MANLEGDYTYHQKLPTIPLIVAVTGHRDLVENEHEDLRKLIKQFFVNLRQQFPIQQLILMSPLAEGADQLAAEVANELSIDLLVPLPKPVPEYLDDFTTEIGKTKFNKLCQHALEVYQVESISTNSNDLTNPQNGKEYAGLGVYLSAHCHILLALWDGKPGVNSGDTGSVVKFHHDDFIPGHIEKTLSSQRMLLDDESDLIFHIVCSRDRQNGSPAEEYQSLDWWWYTKDKINPLSKELPDQHKIIFEQSETFGKDAALFSESFQNDLTEEIQPDNKPKLPIGINEITRLFTLADKLAIHYQKKTLLTLKVTHLLAFLMGCMFIFYSNIVASSIALILFVGFFLLAFISQHFAKKNKWHQKYLDYRTLAEGLRVQYYWTIANINSEYKWKFPHDNFLQSQDPEFGWIRNVMRAAGLRTDATGHQSSSTELNFVQAHWIGNGNNGQLGYYNNVAQDRLKRLKFTQLLGKIALISSVLIVMVFVVFSSLIPEALRGSLQSVMGILLLLFAIREGYVYALAIEETIKQYEQMIRIFNNANARLNLAIDPVEQRQIFLALGQAAFDEHANWLLMHRERSIDKNNIWFMGSS